MTNFVVGQKSLKVVQSNINVTQLLAQLNAAEAYLIDDQQEFTVGPVKKNCVDKYCKLDGDANVGQILQDLDRLIVVIRGDEVKASETKPKSKEAPVKKQEQAQKPQ